MAQNAIKHPAPFPVRRTRHLLQPHLQSVTIADPGIHHTVTMHGQHKVQPSLYHVLGQQNVTGHYTSHTCRYASPHRIIIQRHGSIAQLNIPSLCQHTGNHLPYLFFIHSFVFQMSLCDRGGPPNSAHDRGLPLCHFSLHFAADDHLVDNPAISSAIAFRAIQSARLMWRLPASYCQGLNISKRPSAQASKRLSLGL